MNCRNRWPTRKAGQTNHGAGRAHLMLGVRARRSVVTAIGAVVLLGVSTTTALASRGTSGHASAAKPVLTIGLNAAPSQLNPALDGIDASSVTMRTLADETVLHVNANGTISAGLATSWGYVGKGDKVYEFTLRPGMRFSDGSTVTAKAVANWLNYYDKTAGLSASNGTAGSHIVAIGKWKVKIELPKADPMISLLLTENYNWGQINGPKGLNSSKVDKNPKLLNTQTDGAGPYELSPSQTVAGSTYTLVPNRYYYDQSAVNFSKIVVKIFATPSSMLAAAEAGQIDVAEGDATTAGSAASNGLRVVSAPSGNTATIILGDRVGSTTPALKSADVREALNYAINRKQITSALLGKYGVPTDEIVTPDGFDPKYVSHYTYNVSKAKALLAAGGYPNGFTMTVVDGNFTGPIGDPMVQAVAQELKAIGVTMTVTATSTFSQYIQDVVKSKPGQPGFYAGQAWAYGPEPSLYTYNELYGTKSVFWNLSEADDPVMDRLAAKGSATNSPAVWKDMTDRAVNQGDELPVMEPDQLWYVSKKITGFAASENLLFPQPAGWSKK